MQNKNASVDVADWRWYGLAAHFIGGHDCRFHMATEVGRFMVSTVGAYFPRGSKQDGPEEIGCDRLYETFVFKLTKGRCDCGCGVPKFALSEIDSLPANDAKTATANHYKLCKKYARKAQALTHAGEAP